MGKSTYRDRYKDCKFAQLYMFLFIIGHKIRCAKIVITFLLYIYVYTFISYKYVTI